MSNYEKAQGELPEYERPPVTEVVCSVTFRPLDKFTAAHVGVFWERIRADFPTVEELPPIASPIEIFPGNQFKPEVSFTTVPPLPREMFISADGNFVVRIQRDRFIFNWRKLAPEDQYPRFESIFEQFENHLAVFTEITSLGGAVPNPIQYELTYNNHIPKGDLWESVSDLGKIFPNIDLVLDGAVLKKPEQTNWRTSFVLPNSVGRLHVGIRTDAIRRTDNLPVILLELTARGMGKSSLAEERLDWFTAAREWIVRGFTDFTSEEAQATIWRRTR